MNSDTQQHHYRKNGLDRPLGSAQLAAFAVYVLSFLQYCVFCTPLLSPCVAAPILSVFFFFCVIYVYMHASKTILTNPIDVHLQHHFRQQEHHHRGNGTANGAAAKPLVIRNPLHRPPPPLTQERSIRHSLYYRTNSKHLHLYNAPPVVAETSALPNEPMKQCWICDTSVAEHSMHCKFCNKCVYGFDHHCICTFPVCLESLLCELPF
jgi:DHHC palmitoyltransferase